jgi:hypothetical protein
MFFKGLGETLQVNVKSKDFSILITTSASSQDQIVKYQASYPVSDVPDDVELRLELEAKLDIENSAPLTLHLKVFIFYFFVGLLVC